MMTVNRRKQTLSIITTENKYNIMTTVNVDFTVLIPLAHLLRDDEELFFAPPDVNMNPNRKGAVRVALGLDNTPRHRQITDIIIGCVELVIPHAVQMTVPQIEARGWATRAGGLGARVQALEEAINQLQQTTHQLQQTNHQLQNQVAQILALLQNNNE